MNIKIKVPNLFVVRPYHWPEEKEYVDWGLLFAAVFTVVVVVGMIAGYALGAI